MPAIPVHARIETHMNDDEVKALAKLTEYLVRGAYEPGQSLFLTARPAIPFCPATCLPPPAPFTPPPCAPCANAT